MTSMMRAVRLRYRSLVDKPVYHDIVMNVVLRGKSARYTLKRLDSPFISE